MRLRAVAFAGAALAGVAAGAWGLAGAAADYLERQTAAGLADAFAAAGQDWVEIAVDGLAVRLGGRAPDEASRFRVIEIARGRIDAARLEDAIAVAAPADAATPAFALEILRDGAAVSLIGLVPSEAARREIGAAVAAAGLDGSVHDMLEVADRPAPAGWEPALAFGLELAGELAQAQIGVAAGRVTVAAVAESDADRAALVRRLEAAAPEGVALALEIGAPRPLIAPFVVALQVVPGGPARLIGCSAETEADAAAILAAARAAGAEDAIDCRLGLGAPTPAWAEAAVAGIEAVAALGGGSFSLRNLDALLAGPPDTDPARLAAAGAELDRRLPPVIALSTRGTSLVETAAGPAIVHAPEFRATLISDGSVRLSGPVADRSAQIAIVGFAEAVFGHDKVMNTTLIDPHLPEGWPGRVLAGIKALALLSEGMLAVTPEAVSVTGSSLSEDAEAEIEALFATMGGERPVLDVGFDAAAAVAAASRQLALAAPPPAATAAEVVAAEAAAAEAAAAEATARAGACAAAIDAILEEQTILFESGSARIDAASRPLIDAIAGVLRGCPGVGFEVAGHTDSIGQAAVNQRLSEERAAAVVAALEAEDGLDGVRLAPVGYGPDHPIADNATRAGRALNRRIEFALLDAPATAEGDAAAPDDDDAD